MENTTTNRSVWEGRRTALIIGHPGHELLVHGWMEQAKPVVYVLAANAGDQDESMSFTTAKIVRQAGGRTGSLFGRWTERGLQHALLMGEKNRFNSLAQELADELLQDSIDVVVGDSAEGFDPIHDLCRVLIDAAVGLASRVRPAIRNFEFPLLGGRLTRGTALRQRIDGDALERKLASCRAYGKPIDEVQRRLATDSEALTEEWLRLASPWMIQNRRDVLYAKPGDERISAVQFREHLLPVAGAMQRLASGRTAWAA